MKVLMTDDEFDRFEKKGQTGYGLVFDQLTKTQRELFLGQGYKERVIGEDSFELVPVDNVRCGIRKKRAKPAPIEVDITETIGAGAPLREH